MDNVSRIETAGTRQETDQEVSGSALARSGAAVRPGRTRAQRVWRELRQNKFALTGACFLVFLVIVAIFAPWLAPHSPTEQNIMNRLAPPSRDHWFGTDELGRDELTRLMYGARISLFIGLVGTTGGIILGTLIGLVSGFVGGWIDTIVMRFIDVLFAFPGILLAILIVAVMGPGLSNLIIALTIWGTPALARIVRSSTLSVRSIEYVEAARSIGASRPRVLLQHILPNCAAPIIVYATLGVAGALLTTAGLGFLGIGVQPPTPEWGAMLSVGRSYLRTSALLVVVPGLAILLTVMSLNLIGDALRDALDPRLD